MLFSISFLLAGEIMHTGTSIQETPSGPRKVSPPMVVGLGFVNT